MPEGRGAESRQPDDQWMEYQAEHRVKDRAEDDSDYVVTQATDLDRWRSKIAAMLEADPVVHRPCQHRAKEDDAAKVAVGAQMRDRPELHPDQHRMLENALDV